MTKYELLQYLKPFDDDISIVVQNEYGERVEPMLQYTLADDEGLIVLRV